MKLVESQVCFYLQSGKCSLFHHYSPTPGVSPRSFRIWVRYIAVEPDHRDQNRSGAAQREAPRPTANLDSSVSERDDTFR